MAVARRGERAARIISPGAPLFVDPTRREANKDRNRQRAAIRPESDPKRPSSYSPIQNRRSGPLTTGLGYRAVEATQRRRVSRTIAGGNPTFSKSLIAFLVVEIP